MKPLTKTGEPKTYIYAYKITESTQPAVQVGQIIFDCRRDLVKTWEVWSSITNDHTYFTGRRIGRLCSECYALHDYISTYDHDGEHGRGAPRWSADAAALHLLAAADASEAT